jgi:hypothetical protein
VFLKASANRESKSAPVRESNTMYTASAFNEETSNWLNSDDIKAEHSIEDDFMSTWSLDTAMEGNDNYVILDFDDINPGTVGDFGDRNEVNTLGISHNLKSEQKNETDISLSRKRKTSSNASTSSSETGFSSKKPKGETLQELKARQQPSTTLGVLMLAGIESQEAKKEAEVSSHSSRSAQQLPPAPAPTPLEAVTMESCGREVFEKPRVTPHNSLLESIPAALFKAYTQGDIEGVESLINEYFLPECTYQNMMMPQPRVGREHFLRYFSEMMFMFPDSISVVKRSRVVTDAIGRCVKFTVFHCGTNIAPGTTETHYFDKVKDITPHIDPKYFSPEELKSVQQLADRIRIERQPYSITVRGIFRWGLNTDNKITSCAFHWLFLAIKSASLHMRSEEDDQLDIHHSKR